MKELVLLGDEAVALGAIHAGVSGCFGYPGTPSTEIRELLLIRLSVREGRLPNGARMKKQRMKRPLVYPFPGNGRW